MTLLGRGLFLLLVLGSGAWIGGALFYRLPIAGAALYGALAVWALFALGIVLAEIRRPSWTARLAYVAALIVFALWWSTIQPSNDRDWAFDVEHGVTGTVEGDIVTLRNVRNFDWRSETEASPKWETRRYDLSTIRSVDLFLSYWSSPAIAHTLVSFGFDNGDHVTFSAEIRKEKTEVYSTVAGFFRQYELALIAADERDIIRLRTNIRGEDVYRYPLGMPKAGMRALFLSYLDTGNQLAAQPKFYNTATTNCTTVVFRLIRQLDPGLPFDYRVLLSGYLPSYIYENQGKATGLSFADFRARAAVSAFGKAAAPDADFSKAIRPPSGLLAVGG